MVSNGTESEHIEERRGQRRFRVEIPANVKITTSEMSTPINITDVRIRDISDGGFGLLLTMETPATRQEISRMIVRRRGCHISCHFPGAEQKSRMFGDIIWVEPRGTAGGGIIVRFGVSLDQRDPARLADLRKYITSLQQQGGMGADSAEYGGACTNQPSAS
ncbi:MAG: PilZ domain-containing protein [Candidatus Sumerlaeia bacterium]|nr:PilZ domain-containing protein [Candidatus Sumerlaeia bacterium]